MANEAYDYPQLDLSLLDVDTVERRFAVLEASFGDGYSAAARVGSTAGTISFKLSASVWPDDANIKLIQNKSAFAYYYDFLQDRLRAGNAPFIIGWRGGYYLVQLEEPHLSLEVLTADLFASGIEVRGRRISGIFVRDNASLVYPPEHPGLLGWWTADLFSDLQGVADGDTIDEWPARATAATLKPTTTLPILKINQIAGEPAIRYTKAGHTLPVSGTMQLYEAAFVLKFREATFGGARTLLSFGIAGTQLLAGASGATKFTDLGISGMNYYLNGVQKSASDMQAPMNTYGIVQVKFNAPISINTETALAFRDISGGTEYCPVDIAEILLFQSAVTAQYTTDLFNYLNAKYSIV